MVSDYNLTFMVIEYLQERCKSIKFQIAMTYVDDTVIPILPLSINRSDISLVYVKTVAISQDTPKYLLRNYISLYLLVSLTEQ